MPRSIFRPPSAESARTLVSRNRDSIEQIHNVDELVRSGGINDLEDKGPNGRANQLRATRFIPAVDYIRAQRLRTLLLQQMNAVFTNIDGFLAASSSDSVTMTNLTGHPAIVVPAGMADKLPVALMVTGRLWGEADILSVAAAFEAATDWHCSVQPSEP